MMKILINTTLSLLLLSCSLPAAACWSSAAVAPETGTTELSVTQKPWFDGTTHYLLFDLYRQKENIGSAKVIPQSKNSAYLWTIEINKNERRHGYGSYFCKEIIRKLRAAKYTTFTLTANPYELNDKDGYTRAKALKPLISFYTNIGFKKISQNNELQTANMQLTFVDEKKEEKKFISVVTGGTT